MDDVGVSIFQETSDETDQTIKTGGRKPSTIKVQPVSLGFEFIYNFGELIMRVFFSVAKNDDLGEFGVPPLGVKHVVPGAPKCISF